MKTGELGLGATRRRAPQFGLKAIHDTKGQLGSKLVM